MPGQTVVVAKTYELGPSRRAINKLMKPLIRLGIGGKSTYLLTTTGRRSGQQRTTPVILVEDGGQRWLVSPYGAVAWVHNVRAQPEIALRHGGRTETLNAEEVDPATAGPVLQRYVRKVRVTAPFFDAKGDDPVEKFMEEARHHPVFKLTALSPSLPPTNAGYARGASKPLRPRQGNGAAPGG
jgi:deazaflavin-dependent oxidoreductase (nitroreductase family)